MIQNPKQLAMSEREYEFAMAIAHLLKFREKLGITDSDVLQGSKSNITESNNKTVIKYALEVFKVWVSLYPQEHRDFIDNTDFELATERSLKESIKSGGYTPLSYPVRLDKLYKTMIPGIKTQDKRFWIPLLKHIPQLKRSNSV